MTAIQILSPPRQKFSVDINISCSPEKFSWDSIHGALSTSPPVSRVPAPVRGEEIEGSLFPDLPTLVTGRPEIHLRNGVMNAARASAAQEPDAERAFFVADLSQVYLQHLRWKKNLPEIEPFYAVKCNPDPYVIRLLASLGTGFDCASNGEIAQVLGVGGIDPSRIIFANPCKATSFIRNAARAGVDLMTFDNVDELYKVSRTFPCARLVLRILTDDSKSLCRLGLKFGAPLDAVPGLLAKARELNLDVVGVSFHVGSGSFDIHSFADAIVRARVAFDIGSKAGFDFKLLDVGGGFEHHADFEARAESLRNAIDTHFPDRFARGIRIIAEPGRFYVAKAFSIATNIIARRAPILDASGTSEIAPSTETEDGADQPTVMYYINDGVYGAFNSLMFDHQVVHPRVLSMGGSFHVGASELMSVASVWGPTCDSIDCVSSRVLLPAALRVGDWLAFDDMGAYTRCAASRFNGFELSEVVYTLGAGAEAREVYASLASFANAIEKN